MVYQTANPFEKCFHIEKANVDVGLLQIEKDQKHALAKAFFDFNYAIDIEHGRELEVVVLTRQKCVTLPRSVRNRAKIVYAGNEPIFASFDKNYNLITYMVEGCVIRVEYLGIKGREKKIKYFKCL